MLTNPTLDQMQVLGLAGMAAAWRQLAECQCRVKFPQKLECAPWGGQIEMRN